MRRGLIRSSFGVGTLNRNRAANAVRRQLDRLRLGLSDYQVLLNFDGAPGDRCTAKREEALVMLSTAVKVGATTILAPASTDKACDRTRIIEDLGWLASQAVRRGLKVACEGMAWSTVNHSLPAVWEAVQRVGAPNLGLVVDTFHIFVRGGTAADLDGIPIERIFVVQLSDLAHAVDPRHVIDTARHHRLLPGDGHFPIATVLDRLRAMIFMGPVGLEVFNDEMKTQDPEVVAMRDGQPAATLAGRVSPASGPVSY